MDRSVEETKKLPSEELAAAERLLGRARAGGLVFGMTVSAETLMTAAISSDSESDDEIARSLVLEQYPYFKRYPGLVKAVEVVDDEQCIFARGYQTSEEGRSRIAYVTLDAAMLDLSVDKLGRILAEVKSDRGTGGFYAKLPSLETWGRRDFILVYDSFGGFFEGSSALANGFHIMLAPDVATHRAVVAILAEMGKKEKNADSQKNDARKK